MKVLLFVMLLLILAACAGNYPPGEYVVIPVNQTVTPEVIRYSDSNGEYTIFYGTTPTAVMTPTKTPTPVPTSTPGTVPTLDRCLGTVTADRLNIREAPVTGTVIGTALKGDVLTLDQQTVINGVTWYHIFDGWVSGAWVTLSGICSDLEVVNPF